MDFNSHINTNNIKGKNTLKDSFEESIVKDIFNDSSEPSFNNLIINSNLDNINEIK